MFLYPLLFLSAFLLTALTRRMALARDVIDRPNERSSHQHPTPHGGGIGFVVPFIGLCLYGWLVGQILSLDQFMALAMGGAIIALLGFVDDLHNLSARSRLIIQVLAVSWMLYWVGDIWLYALFPWAGFGWLFAGVAMLWWLNLYNFMDGIDGIAASEGVCVALGAAALLGWGDGGESLLPLLLGLVSVLSGFLLLNWAPAKIFMGDVGSCFIGSVLAVIALLTLQAQLLSIWSWIILTALFWTDATVTLLRRIGLGQTWHQAHRSHAYQILSRRFKSHQRVTLLVIVINLFWLIPMSVAVVLFPTAGIGIALMACSPLIFLQWRIGAGRPEA